MGKGKVLYSYDISKLSNVKKVQFVYLLKGRNGKSGKVRELKGDFIVPGCFFVPKSNAKAIDSIMNKWNVRYKKHGVLMR